MRRYEMPSILINKLRKYFYWSEKDHIEIPPVMNHAASHGTRIPLRSERYSDPELWLFCERSVVFPCRLRKRGFLSEPCTWSNSTSFCNLFTVFLWRLLVICSCHWFWPTMILSQISHRNAICSCRRPESIGMGSCGQSPSFTSESITSNETFLTVVSHCETSVASKPYTGGT